MPVGFVYIVATATQHYMQQSFRNVPTEFEGRIYFGPCKKQMRPKMQLGDYAVGISPAGETPRRILFVTRIEERISFAQAYERFPGLRGPEGPIHVRPVKRGGLRFPESDYEHIPEAAHEDSWVKDLKTRDLDAFFVGAQCGGWLGKWLGRAGPAVDDPIVEFLKDCAVYGSAGRLASTSSASRGKPVAYRGLCTGLHLETDQPEKLVALCEGRVRKETTLPGSSSRERHSVPRSPNGRCS